MNDDPSLGQMMNQAARLLRRLADQRLAPLGLSSGYLPVLTALMARDGLSQKMLTEHAGIEQPTMAATLSRMERDGIIERRPNPQDKRSALFTMTRATREKQRAIRSVIESMNEDALARFTESDRLILRHMLQQVITSLDGAAAAS